MYTKYTQSPIKHAMSCSWPTVHFQLPHYSISNVYSESKKVVPKTYACVCEPMVDIFNI